MKDKKKVKIYYGLLITLIIFAGVSYAWFRLTKTQENKNVIGTRSCLDATLTEETSNIVLDDAFPISDEDGMKQTPFTFTLKNNCEGYVKVYITIDSKYRESASTDYLKDDYVKANLSTKGTTTGQSTLLANNQLIDLENNNKGYILVSTGLKANEEKSYDLRVWVDSETTLEQGLNKSWEGKIVVVGEASEVETLNGAILARNDVKEPLTVPAQETSGYTKDDITKTLTMNISQTYQGYYFTYGTGYEANETNFNLTGASVTTETYANSYSNLVGKYLPAVYANFVNYSNFSSATAGTMKTTTNLGSVYYIVSASLNSLTYKEILSNKNQTEALLASTEDDYGISYYFRGAVRNNYVQFANKCWRIVRITGDGSVKLILHNDNINNSSTPCSSTNNSDTAAFARYSDDLYTNSFNPSSNDNAYMGFMYGTTGTSNYASTHANINKSTTLVNLEAWYEKNNLDMYVDKLADTIWCNDKSVVDGGLGYGSQGTNYGAHNRVTSSGTPSLICPNDKNNGKLSKFTVNDEINGNGALTYKIGLLTADEAAFAGLSVNLPNYSMYLSENAEDIDWWTLSPNSSQNNLFFWVVESSALQSDLIKKNLGLRPAIALKSNVEISGGKGTSEDPYVVN